MTQRVFPVLKYGDARAAIRFLKETFGFQEHLVVPGEGDRVAHAELVADGTWVMVGSEGEGDPIFSETGPVSIYIVIEGPDDHHDRAVAAGAEIVRGLRDEDYGSRGYTARDPEGNLWSFGTYTPVGKS